MMEVSMYQRAFYWGSIVAIIIALILVLVAYWTWSSSGVGAFVVLVFAGLIGGAGYFVYKQTNMSTSEMIRRNVSRAFGRGEASAEGCGCKTPTGGEEFDDADVNELELLETEPSISRSSTHKRSSKQASKQAGKQKKRGGSSAELSGSVKTLVETLNDANANAFGSIYGEYVANPDMDVNIVMERLLERSEDVVRTYESASKDAKASIKGLVDMVAQHDDDPESPWKKLTDRLVVLVE